MHRFWRRYLPWIWLFWAVVAAAMTLKELVI